VDIGTERRIEHGLRRLLAGRTAFVIAHRLSTIRGADRIVAMEDGGIVEAGTHDELLARDGVYSRLYRMTYEDDATRREGGVGSGHNGAAPHHGARATAD
jgi:ATP-binding cassette subfamily B protein